MAKLAVKLAAAVGRRWGYAPVANQAQDVATVVDLFDRILAAFGGTSDIPGTWPTEQTILVAGLAELIGAFQAMHGLPIVDSVIDPFGKTLQLLNQLAADPPIGTFVAGFGGYETDYVMEARSIADPASLPGSKPLVPSLVAVETSRRLIGVTGSSIKWFGVSMNWDISRKVASATPHIFFSPTPDQGGYDDGKYDNLAGWGGLWNDYTGSIGHQIAAAGVNQILVMPIYKKAQKFDLGVFLGHWQEVVSKVVTQAVSDMNPYLLPGPFTFSNIVSSSFSNGTAAHQNFHNKAAGAHAMTSVLFDLDGQASAEGANWRPSKGITYRNALPGGANPVGRTFYIGANRFQRFAAEVNPSDVQYSHYACSKYLLTHGLKTFSP